MKNGFYGLYMPEHGAQQVVSEKNFNSCTKSIHTNSSRKDYLPTILSRIISSKSSISNSISTIR